ncbi:MAG: bifunctional riboflavin kinase/FAD synthetase [Gammaproteobacteria bacterium]|nr:bifunctional riboflavin kinase/FAD synthetase [Gammaproteobacteria bacterium]
MHFVRGLHNLKPEHRHCALTIGNFDGVHQGHQALLRLLAQNSNQRSIPSCLMSFDPLPHEYFCKNDPAPRLTSARERYTSIVALDPSLRPDMLLILPFNEALAQLSAEEFVAQVLVDALAVKVVVIGDDFRFGKGRSGDFDYLRTAGDQYGFEVLSLPTHSVDNVRVSSTGVRKALMEDRLLDAEHMLGRPYRICGRVAHGDKRGRTIGFPTANIRLKRPAIPISGVYTVTLCSTELGEVAGIANIGKRPTVDGVRDQLEVHLFDFAEDIYGMNVCVSFHHKIRDEKKYDTIELLKQQIEIDCVRALELHKSMKNSS